MSAHKDTIVQLLNYILDNDEYSSGDYGKKLAIVMVNGSTVPGEVKRGPIADTYVMRTEIYQPQDPRSSPREPVLLGHAMVYVTADSIFAIQTAMEQSRISPPPRGPVDFSKLKVVG